MYVCIFVCVGKAYMHDMMHLVNLLVSRVGSLIFSSEVLDVHVYVRFVHGFLLCPYQLLLKEEKKTHNQLHFTLFCMATLYNMLLSKVVIIF